MVQCLHWQFGFKREVIAVAVLADVETMHLCSTTCAKSSARVLGPLQHPPLTQTWRYLAPLSAWHWKGQSVSQTCMAPCKYGVIAL